MMQVDQNLHVFFSTAEYSKLVAVSQSKSAAILYIKIALICSSNKKDGLAMSTGAVFQFTPYSVWQAVRVDGTTARFCSNC